jgi:SAM-dependent methyltransferase
MNITRETESRPAFKLIENYMICTALGTLEMHGVLKNINNEGIIINHEKKSETKIDLLVKTLEYLESRNILIKEFSKYKLTEIGKLIYSDIGYLVWFVGGYGNVMSNLQRLIKDPLKYGNTITRDGKWVAIGSALIGFPDIKPYLWKTLNEISFKKVIDIGCGNAAQLLSICETFNCEGIGVDISNEACCEAKKLIKIKRLDSKVKIIEKDASKIEDIPELEKADLIIAFFLLHEIFNIGKEILLNYLKRLSERLPDNAYFLIAEVIPPEMENNKSFNTEFSFIHSMMRQILPSKEMWIKILSESGFIIQHISPLDLPGGNLFLCQVKR